MFLIDVRRIYVVTKIYTKPMCIWRGKCFSHIFHVFICEGNKAVTKIFPFYIITYFSTVYCFKKSCKIVFCTVWIVAPKQQSYLNYSCIPLNEHACIIGRPEYVHKSLGLKCFSKCLTLKFSKLQLWNFSKVAALE